MNILLTQKKIQEAKGAPIPKIMIVDCRYAYEFEGGHISGAVNISTRQELESRFFGSKESIEQIMSEHTIIIFHCEFSQKRGPLLYSILRGIDRQFNQEIYPKLFFPEIYILEGGYS